MTHQNFDALVSDLVAAAAAYYESDVLLMTDAEYDQGVTQVEAALAANPDWATPDSDAILSKVAAGASAGGDVTHPTPMLSMDKVTQGDDDAADRITALVAACTASGGGVTVEPKMDGLALRAVYTDGVLVLAATRGDGRTGEDVTAQALRGISGLPAKVAASFTGEVRGEVVMSVEQFEQAQALRAERGGKPFVNRRNAVAGSLRKTGDEHAMPMTFICYDITDEQPNHNHRLTYASSLGFRTAFEVIECFSHAPTTDVEGVFDRIASMLRERPNLDFEIDGAVVKAASDTDRAALGEGSRAPKWALAWKFPAEETTSVIEDIEVEVGRTGRISLRARITPTFVGGTTVTYATLHNPAWVAEQGLGVGSKVVLKRAGDVIPRITAALDGNDDVEPWTPPASCPKCDGEWDKSSLLWRCHSPECSVAARLVYFASRECMDIEGLGTSICEALAETVFVGGRQVRDVADLYDLTVEELASIVVGATSTGGDRLLGATTAKKIVAELAKSKKQPFNRVITALGIRMTGRSVGRWLAREFPTMERLRAASIDEIASIEKLGEKKATAIVTGLAGMADVIDRLAAHGVNMGSEPDPADDTVKPLTGKTFVISGAVPAGYKNRTEAQEAIEAAGGKASGSVSKTTTALITDETTTSKAKKAEALGIPVVAPDQFAALLRGEVI